VESLRKLRPPELCRSAVAERSDEAMDLCSDEMLRHHRLRRALEELTVRAKPGDVAVEIIDQPHDVERFRRRRVNSERLVAEETHDFSGPCWDLRSLSDGRKHLTHRLDPGVKVA
jgi:hypothetical protein